MNPTLAIPALALLVSGLTVALPGETVTATTKTCRIDQSIYRDADGNGYELIFGPPPPSIYQGIAVIKHPQHGEIYRFLINRTSGYGTIWLVDKGKYNWTTDSLSITFFDHQLKSMPLVFFGDASPTPQYVTITNLGKLDHYRPRNNLVKQPNLKRTPIGDVMWIFDRCQSAQSKSVGD